jgi:hypothetical protein
MSGETAPKERTGEKSGNVTAKREARLKRQAARAEKAAKSDRPLHLCSLAAVDVRKSAEGYQLGINCSGVRRTFTLAPGEVAQVLKDLETAILVIRSQE